MAGVDDIYKALLTAAPAAFGTAWKDAKGFLPAELHKLAVQLQSIAENVAAFELNNDDGYPPATGKVLLEMQKRATENVLMAVTALTLIALEDTLNAVLKAAKGLVSGAVAALL